MDTCNEQQQVLLCQPSSFAQDTQNLGNRWNHQELHDQAMLYTGFGLVGGFLPSNQKCEVYSRVIQVALKKKKNSMLTSSTG